MKNHHSESGQSLVEFALLFGLMLLTMLVFISLSLSVYYQIQLTRLTQDIARIASLAEFETTADTNRKIDIIIHRYAQSSTFPLNVHNENVFHYTIDEIPYLNGLTMLHVQTQYAGLIFPIVGQVHNSTFLAYPKMISGTAP